MEEVKKQGTESLFVTYKIALELQKLGFDENVLRYYDDETKEFCDVMKIIKAPLYQQAFRFFREKYNIRGFITQKVAGDFGFEIYVPNKENPVGKPFNRIGEFTKHFKTYEEAQIACVRKLIEIAKEQK